MTHFLTLPLTNPQTASIFENGEDVPSIDPPAGTVPSVFEDYRNPIQIAAALLSTLSSSSHPSDQTIQLWSAAERHCEYLTLQQEYKLDRLVRQLIDLTMNKMESKVVYFHDYQLLVDNCNRYSTQLMSNSLADLLKEVWRKD